MAGHPPKLQVVHDEVSTQVSYNQTQAVTFVSAKQRVTTLRQCGLLPSGTGINLEKNRIVIRVEWSADMPGRKTREFKRWAARLEAIIHMMNISIQAKHASPEMVSRIRARIKAME